MTNEKEFRFAVECQYLAVPSDAELEHWTRLALFAHRSDAEWFARSISDCNGEEAFVDRRHNPRVRDLKSS